jgi:hypothetical protein
LIIAAFRARFVAGVVRVLGVVDVIERIVGFLIELSIVRFIFLTGKRRRGSGTVRISARGLLSRSWRSRFIEFFILI